jgi:hypothetical protein
VTAYSPLGSPDSASIMRRGEDSRRLLEEPQLAAIAEKCDKSPAQVRWACHVMSHHHRLCCSGSSGLISKHVAACALGVSHHVVQCDTTGGTAAAASASRVVALPYGMRSMQQCC